MEYLIDMTHSLSVIDILFSVQSGFKEKRQFTMIHIENNTLGFMDIENYKKTLMDYSIKYQGCHTLNAILKKQKALIEKIVNEYNTLCKYPFFSEGENADGLSDAIQFYCSIQRDDTHPISWSEIGWKKNDIQYKGWIYSYTPFNEPTERSIASRKLSPNEWFRYYGKDNDNDLISTSNGGLIRKVLLVSRIIQEYTEVGRIDDGKSPFNHKWELTTLQSIAKQLKELGKIDKENTFVEVMQGKQGRINWKTTQTDLKIFLTYFCKQIEYNEAGYPYKIEKGKFPHNEASLLFTVKEKRISKGSFGVIPYNNEYDAIFAMIR